MNRGCRLATRPIIRRGQHALCLFAFAALVWLHWFLAGIHLDLLHVATTSTLTFRIKDCKRRGRPRHLTGAAHLLCDSPIFGLPKARVMFGRRRDKRSKKKKDRKAFTARQNICIRCEEERDGVVGRRRAPLRLRNCGFRFHLFQTFFFFSPFSLGRARR